MLPNEWLTSTFILAAPQNKSEYVMKVGVIRTAAILACMVVSVPSVAFAFTWPGTTHSNGHDITQTQSPGNLSVVFQAPYRGNSATTIQSGSGNGAFIAQGGSNNSATIVQFSHGSSASISQ